MSFAATFAAVLAFILFGGSRSRSSRRAAALIITSSVSVSLTNMGLTLHFGSGPAILGPHRDEPRFEAIDGARGLLRGSLQPRSNYTNALFGRECQSFLGLGEAWLAAIAYRKKTPRTGSSNPIGAPS